MIKYILISALSTFLQDLLFDEKLESPPSSDEDTGVNHSTSSLQKLAHESLSATDIDARKELASNIVLVGAGSQFKGMNNRLMTEISNLCPISYRCRIISPKQTVEKVFAPWIGGSILTSLGSFQQLWLSRQQYDDNGVTLAARRFKC